MAVDSKVYLIDTSANPKKIGMIFLKFVPIYNKNVALCDVFVFYKSN